MPKDIRSFFQQKAKAKPAAVKVNLSDDDEIPESPDVQIKSKKKESRKKRVLNDSSDEEIFTSKKSKKDNHDKTPNGKQEKKSLKEVKPLDLFGSGPIKRTEPIVKKEKKKTETGIHSDEEFEMSLLELDGNEEKLKSPAKVKEETNKDTLKEDKSKFFNKTQESSSNEVAKDSKSEKEAKVKDKKQNEDKNTKAEKKNKGDDVIRVDSDDSSKTADTNENKNESKKENHVRVEKKSEKKSTKLDDSDQGDNKDKSKPPHKSLETENIKTEKDEQKSHHKLTLNKETDKSKAKSPVKEKEKQKSEKKRDFAEFIADDEQKETDNDGKNKKKKLNQSLNSSVLSDEERHERRRHSAALYQSYKNRAGPKNLGAKEMPEGTPNCLKDCAFLLTGVLDSFEREEIAEAIAKYGGTVKNGISKKVTHVIVGEEAGPAKLAKAQDFGITILDEDQFLQMIRDRSKPKDQKESQKSSHDKSTRDKSSNSDKDKKTEASQYKKMNGDHKTEKSDKKKKITPEKMKGFEDKIKSSFYKKSDKEEVKSSKDDKPSSSKLEDKVEIKTDISSEKTNVIKKEAPIPAANSEMWVEKYKPQNIKQIIGQHGENSNVKKLMNWLTKWYVNRKEKLAKPSPWAKNDDGGYYKAALLSGPPGVGKTTTVALVCKEMGFDTVEFNASDTRNKTLIKEQIGELLTTTSLSGFAKGDTGKKAVSKKHVLVMDEVDGMSGNEDRGGLQELISLIKTSAVPIICMCNDRNSEKMRTLVNYCYDLKFSRPRVDQIKSAMLSLCFKEGLKVPPDVLTQLVTSCGQDVRQTINCLSLWAADGPRAAEGSLERDAGRVRKDVRLGSWEAARKVFSSSERRSMSLQDHSDLFFADYSIMPLFVQENYVHVAPNCPKDEILKRMSQAADSISCGDLVEARIRGSQAWSLLPVQAMYSSVIPGSVLSGHVASQIQFPGWLGKNSRASKMKRLAQEIHAHTRLSTTGSKSSIFLDYSKHLRDAIVTPLIKDKNEGIPRSIEVLQAYHLLRDDLDSLTELALWPGQRDPMVLVDSKVKAAMTRSYNKVSAALPHGAPTVRAKRGGGGGEEEEEGGEEEERDSEPENDANIKVKKKTAAKTKDTEKPSTSKGEKGKKGKGKK